MRPLPFLTLTLAAATLTAGCDRRLQPIDPGPPPAGIEPRPAAEQEVHRSEPRGGESRLLAIRYGIALFLPSAEGSARYSAEWTAKALNQLDYNNVPVAAVEAPAPLEGGLEAGVVALAGTEPATSVDLLIAGIVEPGALTRVRLVAVDREKSRVAGQSGFEGLSAAKTLGKALEEILARVPTYWIDLERGENSAITIAIAGIATEEDISRIQQALQALPGVQGVKREQTAVADGKARGIFQIFFAGASGVLNSQLGQLEWQSSRGRARLEPARDGGYRVRYE
jgi:hypothetical protein